MKRETRRNGKLLYYIVELEMSLILNATNTIFNVLIIYTIDIMFVTKNITERKKKKMKYKKIKIGQWMDGWIDQTTKYMIIKGNWSCNHLAHYYADATT
ncbi:hypothetical protein BLOT_008766 [Blomia tropicalis]|nr:hypothetical protein BLOT_008766 [Blomia tropicalis]